MAESVENMDEIISERTSEGMEKCLAAAIDKAKGSFIDVKNAEIRKHPQTVMITVECHKASFYFSCYHILTSSVIYNWTDAR